MATQWIHEISEQTDTRVCRRSLVRKHGTALQFYGRHIGSSPKRLRRAPGGARFGATAHAGSLEEMLREFPARVLEGVVIAPGYS